MQCQVGIKIIITNKRIMKVELQSGDTIAIPEGCKAVVNDGSVVFEKDFEDGDVLHSVINDLMVIYRESSSSECFSSYFNTAHIKDFGWNIRAFRHATEEEKQLLFDKMKEQGLRWNEEEKRVEKMRWRAKKGCIYYFTDSVDISVMQNIDADDKVDRLLWRSYNYFRTREQAGEAAKRIKETLRKYHEEIGE